ncbi:hypothetical protein CU019_0995 [Enterococcus faecium]|nr:hypothetical protein [Enterococcus faecium]MBK4763022.1 hypothetical protein [Enterococcus faecium]MBK4789818.1 hypothetical protein [Enterococcus faecium]MBK4798196.1 hypothetical protein [Enterococcus faecium]MBK4819539.1 hypothetical protein [Enterococcus faecium]
MRTVGTGLSFLYLNGTNFSNYLSFSAENFCYLSKKVITT